MLCSHCRERYYPQIAPALLRAAIRREIRSSCPARSPPQRRAHTVLAGFVEVGETLEQAVARECNGGGAD